MQDVKEEVRSRLNIEDVIGEYVRLQRAGRSFKGLSPFTQERTPSFMVSPDKHVWYDFSSNKGGDIFTFIMQVEGLDFRGSLELLARRAGVDLSLYDTKKDGELSKKKERLRAILVLAAQYYQQTLLKNKRALEYVFETRALSKDIVTDFGIGFAPDTTSAIVDFLQKKGFTREDIKDAGLTNSRGGDLFRSRMMVPLSDAAGQVIGFTGRLLGDIPNAPKYLNTPQTLLYDKSRHVFGLFQAKQAIRTQEKAVLVEGNLDVVSSHQVGVRNVVATAGTALTELQLKSLQRLTPKILLAFDNDRAGLAATERTIPIAQSLSLDLLIVSLPDDAKDPDELIQKDVVLWGKAIENAQPVIDWVLSEYERRFDLSTALGKKEFSSASLKIVGYLQDSIEKEHYVNIIAERTGSRPAAVEAKLEDFQVETPNTPLKKVQKQPAKIEELTQHQDALLSLALFDPDVRTLLIDLPSEHMQDDRALLLEYLKVYQDAIEGDALDVSLANAETYVKILLLRADERYGSWSSLDRYDETAKLVKLIKNETKQNTKKELLDKLRIAEMNNDNTTTIQLREELNELIKGEKK